MVHSQGKAADHRQGTVADGRGLDLGIPGCTSAVEVGRGGFGIVYRAWQPDFHRWVAVKVLAADWHGPSRARFERELKTLGRLSDHPHIVTLHQAGRTVAGNPYLLMAYEEGGSLADRLAAPVPAEAEPAWVAAVAGGIAVAGALEAAHRAGVLHRDVKPGNILISRYGEPKLADFGLARLQPELPEASRRRVTASLPHAAPEVLRGEPASAMSDVYSLASTVLHWIRGRPAFAGDSEAELLRRIAADAVPDLRADNVPDAVCAALERAMAKDPARRQPTAAAFAENLQQAQRAAGRPVTPLVLGTETEAVPRAELLPSHFSPSGRRAQSADGLTATIAQRSGRRPGRFSRTVGALVAAVAVLATAGSTASSATGRVVVPTELAVGEHELHTPSEEFTVTVRNAGSREVRLTGVARAGPHGGDLRLTGDGCSARQLHQGQRCEVRMVFAPREPGARRPLLAVTVAGREVPLFVPVVGTGKLRPASRDDAPPGRCYADAHQVGPSAYGHVGGLRGLSVKQYWSQSCGATMAYVWVWQQYRDTAIPGTWLLDLAVRPVAGGEGARQRAQGQPHELWTVPFPLGAGCTVATATLTHRLTGDSMTATTEPHCG